MVRTSKQRTDWLISLVFLGHKGLLDIFHLSVGTAFSHLLALGSLSEKAGKEALGFPFEAETVAPLTRNPSLAGRLSVWAVGAPRRGLWAE